MTPNQYPEACRTYAKLSPDIYCQKHLDNWLGERGSSLDSYYNWLMFRLNTDNLPLPNLEVKPDFSWIDNLYALG